MQYRPYGKLGYQVSALGMGCMRLPRVCREGQPTEIVDREKAYEIIQYAVKHGINYFDTAYAYHDKTSEEILGEALGGGHRENVKIATKLPFSVMNIPGDIRKNLESSLRKLRTDYVDVYLIHNLQANTMDAIKERCVLEEFKSLKDEGLIRAIGFSFHGSLDPFTEILEYFPWDVCLIQQNIIDVDKEVTEEAIQAVGRKGLALSIMEPLKGGGLAHPPPSVQAIYDAYPIRRSAAEWAFRHLLNYPQIGCVLSGMSTLEQLKENIRIFSQNDIFPENLSVVDQDMLRDIKTAYESLASIPCSECGYCLPCPNGVNIPSVFARYNQGVMFNDFAATKERYAFIIQAGRSAANCIACGLCEGKCPQSIDIIEQLKRSHAALAG